MDINTTMQTETFKELRNNNLIDEVELRNLLIKQEYYSRKGKGEVPKEIVNDLASKHSLGGDSIKAILYQNGCRKKRVLIKNTLSQEQRGINAKI